MNAFAAYFIFRDPVFLWLLLLLPVTALLLGVSERRRLRARALFLGNRSSGKPSDERATLKCILLCGIILFVALALARPSWNPRRQGLQRHSRDVAFVLDVSRSMLAEDLAPSRLERAKSIFDDCLRAMLGESCGLVAVAGEAEVKCPLTVDYDCLRKILMDCGIDSVREGGSLLAKGIDLALEEVLAKSEPGYADLILVTDGGDHGSDIPAAVARLSEAGVRLIVLGIGSPSVGARIPLDGDAGEEGFLLYTGEPVLSSLDSLLLKEMVEESGNGLYFEIATGNIELGEIYRKLSEDSISVSYEDAEAMLWQEGFQIFIGIALLLMAVCFFPWQRLPLPRQSAHTSVCILFALAILSSNARAEDGRSLFADGLAAYESGEYGLARELFVDACRQMPRAPEPEYNLGLALYRAGEYQEASQAFERASEKGEDLALRADCHYNSGNALFRRGTALIGRDIDEALRLFGASISCYNNSLDLAQGEDAVRNLEIAERLYDELKTLQRNQDRDSDSDRQSDEGESDDEGRPSKPDLQVEFGDFEAEGEEFLMPTEDPEDILEQERRDNEQRLDRIESKSTDVEKDW